jgi:hypothetical protein
VSLTYDPAHGDILDASGKQVASLQPGPERDAIGRKMAAAPELEEALLACVTVLHKRGLDTPRAIAALRKAGVL